MREDSPSATAKLVAKNLAIVGAVKETAHLVSQQTEELNNLLIQSFSSKRLGFPINNHNLWFQSLFRFYEKITIPGLALHHALRKLYIENNVRQSIAEGFKQVVILGGGFDTLALRLYKEFSFVNFFELDHPATQRVKRKTIEKRFPGADNLNLLPVDLTGRFFTESLISCPGFQAESDTVFICEGVTMYLEADEVGNIFDQIKRHNSSRKRFIFTFMEINQKGNKNFLNSTVLVQLWLSIKKEPFKWGLQQSELNEFLGAHGFDMEELATSKTLRNLFLQPTDLTRLPLAAGENICICNG